MGIYKYDTIPENEVIAKKVKELRKKKKMTQVAFAEGCSMTEKHLRKIEHGVISPSLMDINNIAKFCQIDAIAFVAPQTDDIMNMKISYIEKTFEEKLVQIESDCNKKIKEMRDLVDDTIKSLKF